MTDTRPIRHADWPKWPQYSDHTLDMLKKVLDSGRWAISGPYAGASLFERKIARAFADFCGTDYCVPCDHGSSALVIALEALNIGFGDEVIIPALTWVATGTAAVNVNAVPVMVDVDPRTLCIDPALVEKAITPRTKAILPVHLYSGMCDMDSLLLISKKCNIPVIEDCAHVHGAKWNNKYAGSMGIMGTFSMQQSKLLTSGEGGAVITNDETIFERLQLLRADARKYSNEKLARHEMEIKTIRKVQGTNYCLSEFQSAILLQQLKELPGQNETRHERASYLFQLLKGVDEIEFQQAYDQVSRTYYCLPFKVQSAQYPYMSQEKTQSYLHGLLSLPVERIYPPVNKVASYFPSSKKRFAISESHIKSLELTDEHYPVAEMAYQSYLTLPHWALLGSEKDMEDIAAAMIQAIRIQKASYGKAAGNKF